MLFQYKFILGYWVNIDDGGRKREPPTLSDDDGWHVDDDNLVFVIAQLENVFIIIINASN